MPITHNCLLVSAIFFLGFVWLCTIADNQHTKSDLRRESQMKAGTVAERVPDEGKNSSRNAMQGNGYDG
jgi:hypothetical protein